jgi:hypothetical protein
LALAEPDEPAELDDEEQLASAIALALMTPVIRKSLGRREMRFMSGGVHQLFVPWVCRW